MMSNRDAALDKAINDLYVTFEDYVPGTKFCGFCYFEDEIKYITSTPVREINEDFSRTLLWETGDHWQNSEVYRHYLPRMLDVLAPPTLCDDLYPGHLFEILKYMEFQKWPEHEQEVVENYLRVVTPFIHHLGDDDRSIWLRGIESI